MVKNQTDRRLKCLRSDNEGEFKSNEFFTFCRQHGIRSEYMAPHSSKQNDIVEHMNRTIQESFVAMLKHSGFSDGVWAESLDTAIHIINLSPSRPFGYKILQELWTGKKSYKLQSFG